MTRHSAFHTTEAIQRILDTTVGSIAAFDGGEAHDLVNGG